MKGNINQQSLFIIELNSITYRFFAWRSFLWCSFFSRSHSRRKFLWVWVWVWVCKSVIKICLPSSLFWHDLQKFQRELFCCESGMLNLRSSINNDLESFIISSFSSMLSRFLRINLKQTFSNSSISCLSATISISTTLSFLNCLQRYFSHNPLRPFITYSSTTGMRSKASCSSSSTSLQ